MKGKAKLLTAGWILLVFSAFIALSYYADPDYKRYYAVEELLHAPSFSAFAGTVSLIIGCNLVTILPLAIGLYLYLVKKSQKGINLAISSLLVFSAVAIRQFQPSAQERGQGASFIASHDSCEYQVIFPHPFKTREASYESLKALLVESKDTETTTRLRAEFMKLPDEYAVGIIFEDMLKNYAYLAGIPNPVITVGDSPLGLKGTYAGVKLIGEYELKYYGVVYLEDASMITCLVVEPLKDFPSLTALCFLDSVSKKKNKAPAD